MTPTQPVEYWKIQPNLLIILSGKSSSKDRHKALTSGKFHLGQQGLLLHLGGCLYCASFYRQYRKCLCSDLYPQAAPNLVVSIKHKCWEG